jgi:fumarate reductase subunit D
MTKKLSARLVFTLVISIVLLLMGLLGLAVRAFSSAVIAGSIFLGAFGVFLVILPIYLILHRRLSRTAMDGKIRRPSSAWPGQILQHKTSESHDRRRPLVRGQVSAEVAHERRSG